MPHDMSDDRPQRSVRSYSGLPALILIAVLIAAVLFVTAGRDDTKVKPATGSARAMALAAERGGDTGKQP
ncbi:MULTISPECIES: hypothetical protein [Sphingomonas]|uniref:hypothetical protein n=1 Tax=Sphingomonas TaxID=13687 RepID=UPI000ABBB6C5|nr:MULTISPECIES: hypothetical protein [Sphingomonas]MBY0300489.1 hypothetical protein [Sphingomonas ginsenosidimutans]